MGFSTNGWVSEDFGLDRGFESFKYIDRYPKGLMDGIFEAERYGSNKSEILRNLISKGQFGKVYEFYKLLKTKQAIDRKTNYPMDKGTGEIVKLLDGLRLKDDKFFIFINAVEPHEPYRNEGLDERWDVILGLKKQTDKRAKEIREEYIKEIEYLDSLFGKMLDSLKAKGVYDDTMIIVLGDHGQAFNEHGFMYHGIYLYDEIIRVPLIIKYPKGKKFIERKGYQSTTCIFSLIKNIVKGNDDRCLTRPTAFSESFGYSHGIPVRYKNRVGEIDPQFYKIRKAKYSKNRKVTTNLTDKKIEEDITYDDRTS